MKKILVSIVLSVSLFKASADEGMWLPMLLGEQVYNDMVKKGLKLSKEQLYSINKSSLKDAILIFGGGCTGEIVSSQGLIFTNHHCGYAAIAGNSTIAHNYLQDGFYAFNKDQELKSELSVQFLDRIIDVTQEVEDGVKGLAWADRVKKIPDVYKAITDKVLDKENGLNGRIYSMFKGNQYIMYVYKTYRDVRLVGAGSPVRVTRRSTRSSRARSPSSWYRVGDRREPGERTWSRVTLPSVASAQPVATRAARSA